MDSDMILINKATICFFHTVLVWFSKKDLFCYGRSMLNTSHLCGSCLLLVFLLLYACQCGQCLACSWETTLSLRHLRKVSFFRVGYFNDDYRYISHHYQGVLDVYTFVSLMTNLFSITALWSHLQCSFLGLIPAWSRLQSIHRVSNYKNFHQQMRCWYPSRFRLGYIVLRISEILRWAPFSRFSGFGL